MLGLTVGLTEAKANLGRITEEVCKTGKPVTIFKNNKPLVVMYPATAGTSNPETLSAVAESQAILVDAPRFTRFEDMMDRLKKDAADV